MKTKILTIALSLVTVLAFGQRKEINNAEDAVEEGNYTKAQTILIQVEPQIAAESDNRKEDFYLVKGQAFLGAENGKNTSLEDLMIAAEAFEKVKALGNEEAAATGILAIRNALVNSAITDQNNEKYLDASAKLYKSYQMGKQDTIYLYYAASNAVNAMNYDLALKYYNELMELGFDGAQTQYTATDKETGEVNSFNSKNEMDLFVKSGQYIDPEITKTPSKVGEIAKNIALIYIEQDKPELAKKAMKKAKKENPEDISLLQAEANMYYELGKIDIYNQLMKEIIKLDPENANLYYNLAVGSVKLGDEESAIEYYKKAIKYNPEMVQAYINMAATILKAENPILDAMNKALADGDNAKYDELEAQREALYHEALPYLQKAKEFKPESVQIIRTLMNIHYVLGNTEKAEALQAKLATLKE